MNADGPTGRRHRTVQSFVRRAGRMTRSQERALDTLWPCFGVDLRDSPLDFNALFGRRAPKVLEIGFGNGDSLVDMAAAGPGQDFIGIEVHEPGIGHCLIRIREAGIDNVRLIADDAVDVLTRHVRPDSLARINLYFPDPWPKKRHHKRRIVQPQFVELCARALAAGGTLNIATDWENYAEHIEVTLEASGEFRLDEHRVHEGDAPLDRPQTKFERRGLTLGHRIHDWRYRCIK